MMIVAVAGITASWMASETLAQRGRRGGGRAAAGVARGGGAAQRLPSAAAPGARGAGGDRITSQIRQQGTPGRSGNLPALQSRPPAFSNRPQGLSTRPQNLSARPQNLQSFLGVNRPPAGQGALGQAALGQGAAAQAALGWANPQHQPFSPAWYAQHPNAFKFTHPHAGVGAAAVVTTAAVARWMTVPYASSSSTAVVSGGYASEPAATTTTEAAAEPSSTAQEPLPGDLAPVADDAHWMPIGVFALKPAGQTEATRVIQLAVSREGIVRGSHYDLISDHVQDVRGAVNKQDLRITWTIGETGSVLFEMPLDEFSREPGRVTLHFPGGQQAVWQTVRVPPATETP